MGLWYLKDSGFELIAYSDADHAGCKDDCKSTSVGLQFLGGKLVSWSSKKQDCTAMSTAEAEYVSLSACCAQEQLRRGSYLAQSFGIFEGIGSKYRLTFMLDKKKLSLTLDDFRIIFYLPQAKANNHDNFVPPPSFLDMVPFYKQQLGFTMEAEDFITFYDNVFCSHGKWRYKDKVGMQIPEWMILEEMKNTEHYRMRSTHLTPLAPVPTVDKADEMILQDTLQVSLAEHKSQEEQKARENVELVNKHLASKEIEKMMKGSENVIDDSLPTLDVDQNIHCTSVRAQVVIRKVLEGGITNDEEGGNYYVSNL
ncbi:hypothetical protein Tco_0613809 [Tanacetum coccineum]